LSITARKKDQSTAPGSWKTQESPLPSGAQDANTSVPLDDVKHSDRANHQSRNDTSHKSRETGSSSALHQKYSNKSLHQQSTSLLGKSPPNVFAEVTVVRQKENNGMHQLANVTGSRQSSQASKKDGSNVKSKTSILEKAIRELEKVVVESRPPAITENQEADTSSQAVKRRLPRDVKLKLAKVARIAQASQGKHSTELINRLMSIVGHLIQLRSLKRNLKIMIDMGDSATREKDTRFKQINNEVLDMIKAKVSLMESQAIKPEGATSDDFQDSVEKPSLKKFVMDAALEDKLCDLYDIFIDGLDEDQGPQTKKLYVNLAELWPNRLMDYRGIKHAIFRAKERRKALYGNLAKEMDQTKMKKSMKQLVPRTDCTAQPNTELVVQRQHSGEKKLIVDPNATSTSVVTSQTMVDRSNQQQPEKLKGISSSCNPTEETRVVKRKNEAVMAEKQVVLALKKPEHPQTRVIPAPQNLNIPRTTPDLNLPS